MWRDHCRLEPYSRYLLTSTVRAAPTHAGESPRVIEIISVTSQRRLLGSETSSNGDFIAVKATDANAAVFRSHASAVENTFHKQISCLSDESQCYAA